MGVATAGVETGGVPSIPGAPAQQGGPCWKCLQGETLRRNEHCKRDRNCWDERKWVARGRGHVWPQEEAVAQLRAGIEGLGLSSWSSIAPGCDPVSPGCPWDSAGQGTRAWGSWGCQDGDTS